MEITVINKSNLAKFFLELVDSEEEINSIEWEVDIPQGVKDKWMQGVPVLTELQPQVDDKMVYEMLLKVMQAYPKWQPGPEPLSENTITIIEGLNKEDKKSLTDAIINNVGTKKEDWKKKLAISEEMLDFLFSHTARPFLKSYAAHVMSQLNLDAWDKGCCPCCGDSPVMSRLTGKYGIRKLHCGRCETEWRFRRVGCPFCGNTDASQLSFITAENYKQYRLYLCEQCKSYLKTVDERQCAEVDLFCEDIATADFDQLALKEGYQRGDKRYRA